MEAIQSIFGGQNAGLTLVMLVMGLFALLVFSFWLFRKISGSNTLKTGRNRQPRLSVTDAAIVDDKRRLVLVRRDNVEHLVMIGGPSDIVIEQNINRINPPQSAQREAPAQREAAFAQRETQAREPQASEISPPTASNGAAAQRLRQPAQRQRIEAAANTVAPSAAAENAAAPAEQQLAAAMPEALMAPAPYDHEPARREAPSIVHNELDIADFEFDLAGELERDIAQPVAANQAPPAQPSLEDALSSELADDMDFAKMLGKDTQSGPSITTPEPAAVQPKPRRQDNVDDEMQRLLDELASA